MFAIAVACILQGCGSGGDADTVAVPPEATQGGNVNKNPAMQKMMGNSRGGGGAPASGIQTGP